MANVSYNPSAPGRGPRATGDTHSMGSQNSVHSKRSLDRYHDPTEPTTNFERRPSWEKADKKNAPWNEKPFRSLDKLNEPNGEVDPRSAPVRRGSGSEAEYNRPIQMLGRRYIPYNDSSQVSVSFEQPAVRRNSWDDTIRKTTNSKPASMAGSQNTLRSNVGILDPSTKKSAPTGPFAKVKEFFTDSKYEKPRAAFLIILLIILVIIMIVVPVAIHQSNQNKGGDSKAAAGSAPFVTLACGYQIQGLLEAGTKVYLGIPYALPPIEEHRWRSPIELTTEKLCKEGMKSANPYKATKFGARCMQNYKGNNIGSEDCLTINVWAPVGATKDMPMPVMVYFHHGDLMTGGGDSIAVYNVSQVARDSGAVIVSFNYRLNAFGYLALSVLRANGGSGNYGLMDQIAALKWVHSNIANFGGNPSKITAFGLGSGGTSILALIASPIAKGLFQNAWIMSGGIVQQNRTLETVESDNAVAFLNKAKDCVSASDVKHCLTHDLTVDDVMGAIPYTTYPNWNQGWKYDLPKKGILSGSLLVIDGVILKTDPIQAIASGTANKVNLLIGNMMNEADVNPPYFKNGQTELTSQEQTNLDNQLKAFSQQTLDAMKALKLEQPIYSEFGFTNAVSYFRTICPYQKIAQAAKNGGFPSVQRYLMKARPTYAYDAFANGFSSKMAFHGEDYVAFFGGVTDKYKTKYDDAPVFQTYIRMFIKDFVNVGHVVDYPQFPGRLFMKYKSVDRISAAQAQQSDDEVNTICSKVPEWWPQYAWVN